MNPSVNTLITLISRQLWPQIFAVLKYRPSYILLLHSQDELESEQPAQRFKQFLQDPKLQLNSSLKVELRSIPYDNFRACPKNVKNIFLQRGGNCCNIGA